MKNNIKKASVKFWEDFLYYQQFMQIFCFCPKSVIITNLNSVVMRSKMAMELQTMQTTIR